MLNLARHLSENLLEDLDPLSDKREGEKETKKEGEREKEFIWDGTPTGVPGRLRTICCKVLTHVVNRDFTQKLTRMK